MKKDVLIVVTYYMDGLKKINEVINMTYVSPKDKKFLRTWGYIIILIIFISGVVVGYYKRRWFG